MLFSGSLQDGQDREVIASALRITALPHRTLDALWECLIYEEPTGEHLFRVLTATIREWHIQAVAHGDECKDPVQRHHYRR
jgi:hypothetical protein